MAEILEELSLSLGLPLLGVLGILALALFLALGGIGVIVMGHRLGFVLGLGPLVLGVSIGVFPVYFVLVGSLLSIGLVYLPVPKTISYRDRIKAVELEGMNREEEGGK